MAKKKEKRQKIDLKQQRDRLNILLEGLSENLGIDNIAGALASTEVFQALVWYLISNTNSTTGEAMSTANKLILAGQLIPTVDLPKGAVLGALLDQGDDIAKSVKEAVEDVEEKAEVLKRDWRKTELTRAECRGYDTVRWESEGKPLVQTGKNKGDPLYTTFVSEPHLYKGNDDCDSFGIPAVCVIRNNETGNKKIVARICEP